MHERQERKATNKLKLTGLGLISAAMIGGGSYTYGVNNTPNTAADSNGNTQTSAAVKSNSSDNVALISDAIDFYFGQNAVKQGISYYPQQAYDIQVVDNNARARINNGDSGAVAYLHYSSPRAGSPSLWKVVGAGQAGLDQQTANQYGMPASWLDRTSNW
jgi:hypothetical protein